MAFNQAHLDYKQIMEDDMQTISLAFINYADGAFVPGRTIMPNMIT